MKTNFRKTRENFNDFLENLKEKYDKKKNIKEENLTKEELIKSIIEAQNDLTEANSRFNFAENRELLSMYIYQIKAAEQRLQYLIRLAEKNDIKITANVKRII